jgi:hypothetical protein
VNAATLLRKSLIIDIVLQIMTDETPNLALEHIRAIREELREIREEQREQRGWLGGIERSISHMAGEIAEVRLRLDRMHAVRPDRAPADLVDA